MLRAAGDLPPAREAEHAARLAALRRRMQAQDLDLVLVSQPDNIFYLTGLDHWGYFVPHLLIVPIEGEPVLTTRAMEGVTIANQVRAARFVGHSDSETVADARAAGRWRRCRRPGASASRPGRRGFRTGWRSAWPSCSPAGSGSTSAASWTRCAG